MSKRNHVIFEKDFGCAILLSKHTDDSHIDIQIIFPTQWSQTAKKIK
jgi:hypothetical protein